MVSELTEKHNPDYTMYMPPITKRKPEHIAKRPRVGVFFGIPTVWKENIQAYCDAQEMDMVAFFRVGLRLAAKQTGIDLDKEE